MATGALAEKVVEDIDQVADVASKINPKMIGYFGIGVGVGIVVGFYIGRRYNKNKIRSEIQAAADIEVAEMREHYRTKRVALNSINKPDIDDIVARKGYAPSEDGDDLPHEEAFRSLRPPVPVTQYDKVRRESSDDEDETTELSEPKREISFNPVSGKDKYEDWNYQKEKEHRQTEVIFVIHQDEYDSNESGYAKAAYTYYEGDNILVDDDDKETIITNKGSIIGHSLRQFGHGSDDSNVVYVRNEEIEIDIMITRVPESWEEEAQGLDANDSD